MSSAAVVAVSELGRILRADDGVPGQVLGLQASAPVWLPPVSATDILDGFFSPDILEKSTPVKYPSFYIYCEKMTNRLLEKFRSFSGSAELVVEVRVSHDHIRELHEQLHWYVQSVTDVLERRRGKWTAGVFYPGGYQVSFQPVKKGGKNFIQCARIQLELVVNSN